MSHPVDHRNFSGWQHHDGVGSSEVWHRWTYVFLLKSAISTLEFGLDLIWHSGLWMGYILFFLTLLYSGSQKGNQNHLSPRALPGLVWQGLNTPSCLLAVLGFLIEPSSKGTATHTSVAFPGCTTLPYLTPSPFHLISLHTFLLMQLLPHWACQRQPSILCLGCC